jgi:AraC-like DNA-binding protein
LTGHRPSSLDRDRSSLQRAKYCLPSLTAKPGNSSAAKSERKNTGEAFCLAIAANAALVSPMVEVNRRTVSERDEPGSWSRVIHDFFGASNVRLREPERFKADVMHGHFGNLEISRITSSSEFTERTPRHVRKGGRDHFVLVKVSNGVVQLKQRGRDREIPTGAFVLIDLNSPWTWEHTQQTEILNITVPAFLLRSRLRTVDQLVCTPTDGKTGLWGITSDLMCSLSEQLASVTPPAAYSYSSHLVELIALAFEAGNVDALESENASVRTVLRRRCISFMRANLADQTLDPERISSSMGISVRYLHRVFQDESETVCASLRELRLEAAHRALANPANSRIAISEIALRFGFKNPAHFAAAFKSKYGISSTEWRRRSPPG